MRKSIMDGMSNDEIEELLKQYEATYELPEITFIPPNKQILDPFLRDRIDRIYHEMTVRRKDWWLLVAGPEGSGKTTMTTGVLWYWCQITGTDFFHQLNTNIVFDDDDMLRLIEKMDFKCNFQYIWADEGSNVFQNRESSKGPRKVFVKYANTVRKYQPFIVIDAVEMKQLDTILLNHRIKSMIRIQEPGIYHYFNEKQFQRLLMINEKRRDKYFNWSSVEPEHVGTFGFSKEFSDLADMLKDNYMARLKIEAGQQRIRNIKKKLALYQESNGKDHRQKRLG